MAETHQQGPPLDRDHDGMPDEWEKAHGHDPSVLDGRADKDGDGYTNLKDYLNQLVAGSSGS